MTRVRVFLGLGLLVAGCAANQGAVAPTPTSPEPIASMTAAITSVPATAPPSSARPTSTAPPSSPRPTCPASSVLTVRAFMDADPTCFGGADASIRAWADTPYATGWEAPLIEPGWLAYPPDGISMLWGVPPTGEEHSCPVDVDPACGAFFVHVRPGSGLSLGDQPGWVIVTGHVGDSAAETCHFVVGEDWPGDPPDDEYARNDCRGNFVLTGVSPALAVPTTSVAASSCPSLPVSLATLTSMDYTPSIGPLQARYGPSVVSIHERAAACYGHRTLVFTAYVAIPEGLGGTRAWSMSPAWLVDRTTYLTSSGSVQDGHSTGRLYEVIVPPGMDRCWGANGNPTCGGGELGYLSGRQVEVRGHFNDAAASGCRASGEPDVTPSAAEAVRICRAEFVVTSVWAIGPATDTATPTRDTATPASDRAFLPPLVIVGVALIGAWASLRRRESGPA